MKASVGIVRHLLLILALSFCFSICFSTSVHAETYWFTLDTKVEDNWEHATLTAENAAGQVVWTYNSGWYQAAELSNFQLILNNGYVYLVEGGSIKLLDFYTGKVKWTNSDFGGSPAKGCYAFSSSGKLYIGGYYGPDLFVVDTDGNTICRVNQLCPGSYNMRSMWWYGGDDMRVIYDSNSVLFTFNVLDYFGRKDGLK